MRKINYPKHRKTTVEVERFWSKVQKSNGCWLWTGGTNPKGYGRFAMGNRRYSMVMVLAHRYSWVLANGPILDGLCVLHECDTPACVRPGPGHLFLGTRADNNADMDRKGRSNRRGFAIGRERHPEWWPTGASVPGAKLTDRKVRRIRVLYATGEWSYVRLAAKYEVGRTTVENIVKQRKWKHVT